MTKQTNSSYVNDWKKYSNDVYLLRKGALTDFEEKFLSTIHRNYGTLSLKQREILDNIIKKYFICANPRSK